jgi:hypothetical protein
MCLQFSLLEFLHLLLQAQPVPEQGAVHQRKCEQAEEKYHPHICGHIEGPHCCRIGAANDYGVNGAEDVYRGES